MLSERGIKIARTRMMNKVKRLKEEAEHYREIVATTTISGQMRCPVCGKPVDIIKNATKCHICGWWKE